MSQGRVNAFLSILGTTPAYRDLFASAYQIMRLQCTFQKFISPHLAEHCAIEKFSNGILVIGAENSAVAARLRQIAPSLCKRLGAQINSIQIVVRANRRKHSNNAIAKSKPMLNQAAIHNLKQLALDLPESPLKLAIESLLDNCKTH